MKVICRKHRLLFATSRHLPCAFLLPACFRPFPIQCMGRSWCGDVYGERSPAEAGRCGMETMDDCRKRKGSLLVKAADCCPETWLPSLAFAQSLSNQPEDMWTAYVPHFLGAQLDSLELDLQKPVGGFEHTNAVCPEKTSSYWSQMKRPK